MPKLRGGTACVLRRTTVREPIPYRLALALVLALGLMTPTTPAHSDEGTLVAKLATVAPDRTPWADLLKRYRKKVRKATKGAIKLRLFLGGIKGDELSSVRQAFRGTDVHIAAVSTGALSALVPDIDILELPYLFDSFAEADRILDGPARPIVEEIVAGKGFKLIMFSENGYRSFGTRGGFIRTLKDLKAKKMRSQETPVHVETYRALGASPVTISVGEVLSALQTGVVDGFDNTPLFTQAVSWHQAIDHFTVTEHIYQPAVLVANARWFSGLPADIQKALVEEGQKLERRGRKAVRALGPLLLENFQTQKVAVYHPTEAEKAAFKKATRPVWDKRRASAGPLGKKLLDAILKAKGAR